MSQTELAAIAGVSRPTISRIESGQDVTAAVLDKVAQALDLRLELNPSVGELTVRVAVPE